LRSQSAWLPFERRRRSGPQAVAERRPGARDATAV